MAKEKMTVTITGSVRADVDADAREAGLSRSEYVERVLENEHYRRLLARMEAPSMTADDERFAADVIRWQHQSTS